MKLPAQPDVRMVKNADGVMETVIGGAFPPEPDEAAERSDLDDRMAKGIGITNEDRMNWCALHIGDKKGVKHRSRDRAARNLLIWARANQKDFWNRWFKLVGDSSESSADKRQKVLLSTIDEVYKTAAGAVAEATQALFGDDIDLPQLDLPDNSDADEFTERNASGPSTARPAD